MSRFGCGSVEDRAKQTPGGRADAVVATQSYPPGTVGHVVHRAVKTVEPVAREVASGTIGDHYREPETVKLMNEADTDDNLQKMAMRETKYWNEQAPEGCPRRVGSTMSAPTRYGTLVATRDGSFINGANARCSMQRSQPGGCVIQ